MSTNNNDSSKGKKISFLGFTITRLESKSNQQSVKNRDTSDTNDSSKEKETSFLIKAISDDQYLARALILLRVAFAASLAVFICLAILVFMIVYLLTDQVEQISTSEQDRVIVKLRERGKGILQVISVPAYDRWTQSGIILNKKTKIEIKATGLVATGYYFPQYISNEIYGNVKEKEGNVKEKEEDKRLSRIEFNEQVYLGWRYPNGTLVASQKSDLASPPYMKCIERNSNHTKILPNSEYGTLLAFFAKLNSVESDPDSPDHIFKNKTAAKFAEIGKGASIEFNKEKDVYLVSYKDKNGVD